MIDLTDAKIQLRNEFFALIIQGVILRDGDVKSLHLLPLGLSAEFPRPVSLTLPCARKQKLPAIKLKMEGKEHLKHREGNELKSV